MPLGGEAGVRRRERRFGDLLALFDFHQDRGFLFLGRRGGDVVHALGLGVVGPFLWGFGFLAALLCAGVFIKVEGFGFGLAFDGDVALNRDLGRAGRRRRVILGARVRAARGGVEIDQFRELRVLDFRVEEGFLAVVRAFGLKFQILDVLDRIGLKGFPGRGPRSDRGFFVQRRGGVRLGGLFGGTVRGLAALGGHKAFSFLRPGFRLE